jgi:hypothetical protein
MSILRVLWDDGPDGNVEHILEHGLTKEDIEYVLDNFYAEDVS